MSTIIHRPMFVASYDILKINHAYSKAMALFGDRMMVGSIGHSKWNEIYYLNIYPDGSKEGWPQSETAKKQRIQFAEWLEEQGGYSYIVVAFGECEPLIEIQDYKEIAATNSLSPLLIKVSLGQQILLVKDTSGMYYIESDETLIPIIKDSNIVSQDLYSKDKDGLSLLDKLFQRLCNLQENKEI